MTRLATAYLLFFATVTMADTLGNPRGYLTFLALSMAFFIAAGLFGSRCWNAVFAAIVGASMIFCAIALAQMLVGFPRARAVFHSANFLGSYAMLAFFAAIWLSARACGFYHWLGITGATASILALLMSQSRAAIFSTAFGVAVLFGRRRPEMVMLVFAVAGVAIVLVGATHTGLLDDPRFPIWAMGWKVASQRLVFGWGQGAIFNEFYNVALTWLVAAGIPGLAAFLYLAYEATRAALRLEPAREKAAILGFLAAYAVNGMFMFDTAATVLPLLAVLAYLASIGRDVNDVALLVDEDDALLRRGRARRMRRPA